MCRLKRNVNARGVGLAVVFLLIGATAFGSGSGESEASGGPDWPTESEVQFIVPFPAGGTADVVLRKIAQMAEPLFDQPLVVVNRPGAGGTVAAAEYLAEGPNTNKIIYVIDSVLTAAPMVQDVPFDHTDFMPVIGVELVNFILYVNPAESGIDSVESLVEYARDNRILYSVGGPLAPNALIQQEFFRQMGADAEMVVFNGAIEGVNSLAAGDVHVTAVTPAHGKNFVSRGDFVPLMVFSDVPYEGFADVEVPPASAFGYDLEFTALLYLAIRAGTDPAVVQLIYERLATVYEDEEYVDFMQDNMLSISRMAPDEIDAYIEAKMETVRDLLPR